MKSTLSAYSAEIRAQHLDSVALHEICHAFVELHRSEAIRITLNLNPNYPHQPHSKIWDGRVEAKVLNDDKFRDSVFGWAGMIGEAIEKNRSMAIDIALERYKKSRNTLSDSDLAGIESIADLIRPKSAQTAYDTLLENWGDVKDVQKRVIKLIGKYNLPTLMFGWTNVEGWVGLEADK